MASIALRRYALMPTRCTNPRDCPGIRKKKKVLSQSCRKQKADFRYWNDRHPPATTRIARALQPMSCLAQVKTTSVYRGSKQAARFHLHRRQHDRVLSTATAGSLTSRLPPAGLPWVATRSASSSHPSALRAPAIPHVRPRANLHNQGTNGSLTFATSLCLAGSVTSCTSAAKSSILHKQLKGEKGFCSKLSQGVENKQFDL